MCIRDRFEGAVPSAEARGLRQRTQRHEWRAPEGATSCGSVASGSLLVLRDSSWRFAAEPCGLHRSSEGVDFHIVTELACESTIATVAFGRAAIKIARASWRLSCGRKHEWHPVGAYGHLPSRVVASIRF